MGRSTSEHHLSVYLVEISAKTSSREDRPLLSDMPVMSRAASVAAE